MAQKTIRVKTVSPKAHLLEQQQPRLQSPIRQPLVPPLLSPTRDFFPPPSLAQTDAQKGIDGPDPHFQALLSDDF